MKHLTLALLALALAGPIAAQYGAVPPLVRMAPLPAARDLPPIPPVPELPPLRRGKVGPEQWAICGGDSKCGGTAIRSRPPAAPPPPAAASWTRSIYVNVDAAPGAAPEPAAYKPRPRQSYEEIVAGLKSRAERWAANAGGVRDYFVRSNR